MDKSSKIVQNRSEWSSYIKVGTLSMTMKNEKFKLEWDNTEKEFRTGYSYKGRGMELSELIVFNGKLLTFDDRTGIVFEIHDNEALPWVILRSPKSNRFKIEWATVKDEKLYIGSTGKPWVSKTGEIIHDYDLKVKVVNSQGHIRGQNWTEEYRKIQEAVNITFPGMHKNSFRNLFSFKNIFLRISDPRIRCLVARAKAMVFLATPLLL